MRRFSFSGTLLVIVTLVAGLSWLGLRLIGRSFLDDENEGSIEGLSAQTTITRDLYGVAYIQADNENDAMAALGYAHAQDRLWQMDLMRRAGEGRLSEIFGRTTITYDALLKTIGFSRTAKAIVSAMPRRTRAALDAYCRGVNAYIEDNPGHLPMEFDALGYEPEPWKPEHTVMISRLLAWELNTAFWTDIVLAEIQGRVDSVRFSQILPYYPSDAPTVIPGGQRPEPLMEALNAPPDTARRDTTADSSAVDSAKARRPAHIDTARRAAPRAPGRQTALPAEQAPRFKAPWFKAPRFDAAMLASLIPIEREMRRFIGIDGASIGSNAWAIAPNRTAAGKAMLANDPHLPHTAPSRWYQAVISVKNARTAGVTLPGMPFIVIGRNNDVAWGLTSMMADETDFYVEQFDSAKRTTVRYGDAWEKLRTLRDTIHVKDSASVPMTIRSSRHGPLISDLHPFAFRRGRGGAPIVDSSSMFFRTAIAMRWRGSDVSQELAALQGINNARSLEQFTAAARLGGVPSLSYVYADRRGTIASIPVARIPVREAGNPNLPSPGWDGRYDWKGTIPPERLPMLVNPARGYVASANNKVANGLAFSMGDLWEDPSRAQRLDELLKDGNNFSVTDFVQMQGDLLSPHMRTMKDFLLRAFPDSAKQGSAVQRALRLLRGWNGTMSADAPAAAIAAQWLQTVLEMTYRDELGPDLYRNYLTMAQQPTRAIRYHAMIDSRWFDDAATRDRVERRDDILRKALGRALDSLHKFFDGNSPAFGFDNWRWGAMHTLTFTHPFTEDATLRSIVNIGPLELGGASTTLNNSEWDLNKPFSVRVGPSMRQIVDFADTSAFLRSVITSGSSGQPLNQFYSNQTVLWMSNGYLSLSAANPEGTAVTSVTVLEGR